MWALLLMDSRVQNPEGQEVVSRLQTSHKQDVPPPPGDFLHESLACRSIFTSESDS